MSTRGALVFVSRGVEKVTYNQYDSYPSGIGVAVLNWLRASEWDEVTVRAQVDALRMVSRDEEPSLEDKERYGKYADPHVNMGRGWYSLLRETQGNPALILEAGVAEDASDFPRDSLFCEWAYVVDFDTQRFEVYEGFQESPHSAGRWASAEPFDTHGPVPGIYYPVKLLVSWSFADLRASEISSASAMDVVENYVSELESTRSSALALEVPTEASIAALPVLSEDE